MPSDKLLDSAEADRDLLQRVSSLPADALLAKITVERIKRCADVTQVIVNDHGDIGHAE